MARTFTHHSQQGEFGRDTYMVDYDSKYKAHPQLIQPFAISEPLALKVCFTK